MKSVWQNKGKKRRVAPETLALYEDCKAKGVDPHETIMKTARWRLTVCGEWRLRSNIFRQQSIENAARDELCAGIEA